MCLKENKATVDDAIRGGVTLPVLPQHGIKPGSIINSGLVMVAHLSLVTAPPITRSRTGHIRVATC
jgi:hypothetical protein